MFFQAKCNAEIQVQCDGATIKSVNPAGALSEISFTALPGKTYRVAESEPSSVSRLTVKGGRFLTLNTVIRVNQIEAARNLNEGVDEAAIHTPETVAALRGKMAPEIWNPHDGKIGPAKVEHVIGKEGPATRVQVKLAPVRSLFLVAGLDAVTAVPK